MHVPDDGAVTVQTLDESTAIPAPDSVMAIPALPDEVEIARVGRNDTEAVVDVAFFEDASSILRLIEIRI